MVQLFTFSEFCDCVCYSFSTFGLRNKNWVSLQGPWWCDVLFHQMDGTRPLWHISNAQLGNCKAQLFLESRGRELADCLEQSIWQFSDWIRAVICLYGTHYRLYFFPHKYCFSFKTLWHTEVFLLKRENCDVLGWKLSSLVILCSCNL